MKIKILSIALVSLLLFSCILTNISALYTKEIKSEVNNSCYGYIITVTKNQTNDLQINITKTVNELLKAKIEVFWIKNEINVSSKNFNESSSVKINNFKQGSFIIPFCKNQSMNTKATTILYKYYFGESVTIFRLMQTLENIELYQLFEPKIAIHNGPEVLTYSYARCLREAGFESYNFLNWDEIPKKLNNKEYNTFIWGGGWGVRSRLKMFIEPLKFKKVINKVSNFVRNGGGYVGSCYGLDSSSKIGCDFEPSFINPWMLMRRLLKLKLISYGVVIQKVVNTNNPVTYGIDEYIPIWHDSDAFIDSYGPNTEPIAKYYSVAENYPWNPKTPDFLKNLYWKNFEGKISILSSKLEKGKTVSFHSHPEMYFYVEKYSKYTCPPRLVHNSIFYVTSKGPIYKNITERLEFSNIEININDIFNKNVGDLNDFQCNIINGTNPYIYYWNFGNNISSTNSNPSHRYLEPGNFSVILTVIDKNNRIGVDRLELNINGSSIIVNNPPDKPIEQNGNRITKLKKTFYLTISANDPDNDPFWYKLKIKKDEDDWKEMPLYSYLEVNKSSYFLWESNQNYERDTRIDELGTYLIKVKAIDVHGAESEWSNPVEIIVTRHPLISKIFNR